MKERPILFSAPMVRAILAGDKTQTRRIIKNKIYVNGFHFDGRDILCHIDNLPPSAMLMDARRGKYHYTASNLEGWEAECPHGQPGDRLWVRETWQGPLFDYDDMDAYQRDNEAFETPAYCQYRADGGPTPEYLDPNDEMQCKWRPSIHMPRWASRITLEITGVRVERLQDISEQDAIAEGARSLPLEMFKCEKNLPARWNDDDLDSARFEFAALWQSINGTSSWDANPWVWVVEFKQIGREGA